MVAVPSRAGTEQAVDHLLKDLGGVLDPTVLGQRAARTLGSRLNLPMVSFALSEGSRGAYAMRGVEGGRTKELEHLRVGPGQGIGGRAVAEGKTVAVEDYGTDPRITDHFRAVVEREQLHGMAAVPIQHDGDTVGILYGGRRAWGRPADQAIHGLEAASTVLAPLLATSLAAQERTRLCVSQERQRIAGALHDDVGQLLFAISAAARRAGELTRTGDLELTCAVKRIDELADLAGGRLREALGDLTPSSPLDRIPVAAQRDLADFTDRSGIPAHLLLPREPFAVPPAVERAALACLRQALFNVERHAAASLVIVTLEFQPGLLTLIVQDDGVGPPPDFQPRAMPENGHNWGCTAMLRHAEQLGGSVMLEGGEEGGARLRVDLPVPVSVTP